MIRALVIAGAVWLAGVGVMVLGQGWNVSCHMKMGFLYGSAQLPLLLLTNNAPIILTRRYLGSEMLGRGIG